MKKLIASAACVMALVLGSTANAQAPAGFEGTWQTKEWFGTIANMKIVPCEPDGPYCVQVVSLAMGDGMEPGSLFMTGLELRGKNLRGGAMKIPNGPSLPGGIFWISDTQVELKALGANEVWERID